VIGKTMRDLPVSIYDTAWKNAIESYIVSIDMTARNVQDEAKKKGLPWDIAKGFDTFLPISAPVSPGIVKDPHDVELWLSVNGKMRQHDSTNLMLFQIGRQLSDISRVMTLEKGDIVLTGTPKGVGPVVPGDVMEAGLKVDGRDIDEARIKVEVKERHGLYDFAET
jgi:2-keto-4-pentenoate hydratase/2-oxohepta-3-ene-1,7-dioic acid hydratase in catechol pathway